MFLFFCHLKHQFLFPSYFLCFCHLAFLFLERHLVFSLQGSVDPQVEILDHEKVKGQRL